MTLSDYHTRSELRACKPVFTSECLWVEIFCWHTAASDPVCFCVSPFPQPALLRRTGSAGGEFAAVGRREATVRRPRPHADAPPHGRRPQEPDGRARRRPKVASASLDGARRPLLARLWPPLLLFPERTTRATPPRFSDPRTPPPAPPLTAPGSLLVPDQPTGRLVSAWPLGSTWSRNKKLLHISSLRPNSTEHDVKTRQSRCKTKTLIKFSGTKHPEVHYGKCGWNLNVTTCI